MCTGIGEIEIDLSADQIIHHHVFAWGTKSEGSLIFKNVAGLLQAAQIPLINVVALALKIGSEIATDVRTFVPIELQPLQTLINRGGGFLGIARAVRVFDAQNKLAIV